MISGANENELEIANARADVLLSIDDDRQHLRGLIKYWREECFKQDKQLEAYENMRKEAIKYIEDNSAFLENDEYEVFNKRELLNILNKVGEDNE